MKCCKCGVNVNQPHLHYVLDANRPQRVWCINCASAALANVTLCPHGPYSETTCRLCNRDRYAKEHHPAAEAVPEPWHPVMRW